MYTIFVHSNCTEKINFMAINKNAWIRYKTLDKCFSSRYKKYYIYDLIAECDKVLAEIAQNKDVSRLDAALADVLAQADQGENKQRTQWAELIPSMTFEQKLHVLDVLANERFSVLASDADAPRP